MRQPYVKMYCPLMLREETFWFIIGEDGLPYPNYCEQYHPCAECKSCSINALDKLIASLSNPDRP